MITVSLLAAGATMFGYGVKRFAEGSPDALALTNRARQRKQLGRLARNAQRDPGNEVVADERFNPAATLDLIWQPSHKELQVQESVAWMTLGLAVGSLALPILAIPCIPLLVYRCSPFLKVAYSDLFKEKQITLAVLLTVVLVGGLASGFLLALSIASWILAQIYGALFRAQYGVQRSMLTQFGEIPEHAWVLRDGAEVEVSLAEIKVGETIVVNAGETIPLDGTVVAGSALVDQHRLTGESQPVERECDEEVFAATLVVTGRLEVRVDKPGHESAVANIAEAVNNAVEYRSDFVTRSRRMGDKVAPPMLLLSLITLPLRGPSGALAILESNFGYNIRFVGPITMMSFLELASRQQVLIKDARSMEILNTIDTVVFDKTGTLTEEQPTLHRIHAQGEWQSDDLLALAAAAEQRLGHPVARAIRGAARARGLARLKVEQAEYSMGLGLQVTIAGRKVQLGSARYMERSAVVVPESIAEVHAESADLGHSLVYLAVDGQLAGVLELRPTYRREAAGLIAALRERGLKTYLISGDHEAPTRQLAQELGIDQYHADTLPEQKAELVKQLQEEGRSVCFVGDGINDSVAMMQANVSVSLQGATTVATDTAHIVMLNPNLDQFVPLLDLARRYERHIDQGIRLSMIPGALCIGGVMLFHLGFLGSVFIFTGGLASGVVHALLPRLQAHPEAESNESGEQGHA